MLTCGLPAGSATAVLVIPSAGCPVTTPVWEHNRLSGHYSNNGEVAGKHGIGVDIEEVAAMPQVPDFRSAEFYQLNFACGQKSRIASCRQIPILLLPVFSLQKRRLSKPMPSVPGTALQYF